MSLFQGFWYKSLDMEHVTLNFLFLSDLSYYSGNILSTLFTNGSWKICKQAASLKAGFKARGKKSWLIIWNLWHHDEMMTFELCNFAWKEISWFIEIRCLQKWKSIFYIFWAMFKKKQEVDESVTCLKTSAVVYLFF